MKRHFMNIYFNNFVTDFPSFLFEFNQNRKKENREKQWNFFFHLLSSNKQTSNQIENYSKGRFSFFPEQFFSQSFFRFIWFEKKKLIKNEKFNSEWKIFPHSDIYWEKEKGKYGKRVWFHMQFFGSVQNNMDFETQPSSTPINQSKWNFQPPISSDVTQSKNTIQTRNTKITLQI